MKTPTWKFLIARALFDIAVMALFAKLVIVPIVLYALR